MIPDGQAQVKFLTKVSESVVPFRQTFQVQYIIEGAEEIDKVAVPRFDGFRVEVSFDTPNAPSPDPQTGQVINSYSKIVVLRPVRTGRFTIKGASAIIDGKKMQSNPVNVTVQQTGLSSLNSYGEIDIEEESELRQGEDIAGKIRDNMFLRIETNKTSCFVGEPVRVVYKAWSRLNANSQVVKRPSLTGFSVMEMVDSYDNKPEIEWLNGLPYYTNIIRKVQLFPLQEGKFDLDQAEIETEIRFVRIGNKPDSKQELRQMLSPSSPSPSPRTPFNYHTILRTKPLTITVKPLPAAGQPRGFSGAVGNFSLAVKVSSINIRQGDLVKIHVVISGTGNLSLLTPPPVQWPAGVDTGAPRVTEAVNKYIYPLAGSKTFEYSFAAPDTGNYVIPAVQLSYFDPEEETYKTSSSNPVTLHVAPRAVKTKQEEGQETGNSAEAIPRQFYWFALVILAAITWILFQVTGLLKSKAAARQTDKAVAEQEAAKPFTAAEILSPAQKALQAGDRYWFYHEIQQSLWNVIAARYSVAPSALNKHNVTRILAEHGVAAADIRELITVLDQCEWTLYTPAEEEQDMKGLLVRAEAVIEKLG